MDENEITPAAEEVVEAPAMEEGAEEVVAEAEAPVEGTEGEEEAA